MIGRWLMRWLDRGQPTAHNDAGQEPGDMDAARRERIQGQMNAALYRLVDERTRRHEQIVARMRALGAEADVLGRRGKRR